MTERPYYLLGSRRLAQLQEEVLAALAPLVQRWWPEPPALQLRIENFAGAAALRSDELRYLVREDRGTSRRDAVQDDERWFALLGSEREFLALAEGWLGCRVAAPSDLIALLLRTFSEELFTALAPDAATGTPTVEARPDWSQLPTNLDRAGAGTLVLDIALAEARCTLLTSAALWPALAALPQAHQRDTALTPCNQALGECRVDIDAMLPAVRLPLADIAALAEGDFLNLGHDLSGSVQLRDAGGTLDLTAIVGRQAQHKAVRLRADH
jgi:hypothetical protein